MGQQTNIYEVTKSESEAVFDNLAVEVSLLIVRHEMRCRDADRSRIAELEDCIRAMIETAYEPIDTRRGVVERAQRTLGN